MRPISWLDDKRAERDSTDPDDPLTVWELKPFWDLLRERGYYRSARDLLDFASIVGEREEEYIEFTIKAWPNEGNGVVFGRSRTVEEQERYEEWAKDNPPPF